MTQNENPEGPSLAEKSPMHYAVSSKSPFTPCGLDRDRAGVPVTWEWSRVTCGACRLEMPEQGVPGRREYRVPADVLQRDSSLAEDDQETFESAAGVIRSEEMRLAQAEATYRTLSENIEYLKERREEARAEREDAVRALSLLRSPEKLAEHLGSVQSVTKPAETLSGAPVHPTCIESTGLIEVSQGRRSFICGPHCPPPIARFRVKMPLDAGCLLTRAGDVGEFVRRGRQQSHGGTMVTIRFEDGDERTYAERFLTPVS